MKKQPAHAPSSDSTDEDNDSFVRRRFSVEGLNDGLHTSTATRALTQQPGVQSIRIDFNHGHICICYDNTIVGVEAVVEGLKNAGYPLRQRFWDRLKYTWWRYLDENARSNATSVNGPCCSNPATLHAQRRRH